MEAKIEKREENGEKKTKPLIMFVLSVRSKSKRMIHAAYCREEQEQRSGGSSK